MSVQELVTKLREMEGKAQSGPFAHMPITRPLLSALLRIIERQREAIEVITQFDRKRGYPTGAEWIELDHRMRAALTDCDALAKWVMG